MDYQYIRINVNSQSSLAKNPTNIYCEPSLLISVDWLHVYWQRLEIAILEGTKSKIIYHTTPCDVYTSY